MIKLRDQTKVLTSKLSNCNKYNDFQSRNPKVPIKLFVLDTNETRVASCYELIKSNLYLKIPLTAFFAEENIEPFLTAHEREVEREIEDVLRIQ